MSGFPSPSSSILIRIGLFILLSLSFINVNSALTCNGVTCPFVTSATLNPTCSSSDGSCDYTCAAGKGNCDNTFTNGCETNLLGNARNCGTCGFDCTTLPNVRAASCGSGHCSITCTNSSYSNCDADTSNGCEAFLPQDPNHCGGCSNNCLNQPNVANAVCNSGKCHITQCAAGYSDCFPGVPGCETYTTDCSCIPSQCPALSNAARSCQTGQCTGVCANGWGDCNNDTTVATYPGADGCETPLTYDSTNCGACGNDCSQLPGINYASCKNGTCNFFCAAGRGDCDAIPSNGCEANFASDPNNCATCGYDCTTLPNVATATCTNWKCGITSCQPGFSNCDGLSDNGCETIGTLCPCFPSQCPTVRNGIRTLR
eukprot:TRINITY_DN1348_c0_g1_i2.p1 TRINITY_DN1348_c0_g1~~TRINITY_DN1348_c0_g1_i2.p1  ORF type:complete len:372 (+),score=34.16 TRINITY_DN1348_c0_g1_i2:363-1478(+)